MYDGANDEEDIPLIYPVMDEASRGDKFTSQMDIVTLGKTCGCFGMSVDKFNGTVTFKSTLAS